MIKKAFNSLKSIAGFILCAALFVAILSKFDWDIFAFVLWTFDIAWIVIISIWNLIVTIAGKFTEMDAFNSLF